MRTYKWSKRELVDAVFYLVDSGCKWRELPHDFPPCFTVHSLLLIFFADMGYRGTFKRVVEEELGCAVAISPQIKPKGFVVQALRWVVERTFA